MPKNEPDASDPMELVPVRAGGGEGSLLAMAECLAEEFLSLGYGPREVLALFRSSDYALPHRAWLELGEVRVFTLVFEIARRRARPQGAAHHA